MEECGMMRSNRQIAITLHVVLAVVALLAAPVGTLRGAQAQPEKRVENVNSLVGTWRGERKNPQGEVQPVTLTIKENGVVEAYTPLAWLFTGTITVADGKMSYRTLSGAAGGPVVLYEDSNGKTFLRFTNTAASPPRTTEYERQ